MKAFFTIILALSLTGCHLPQWRIFQAKVDPKLGEKAATQVEAEREGAQFVYLRISRLLKSGNLQETIRRELSEIQDVSAALSASLGQPKHPVALDNKDAIILQLQKGIQAEQKKAEQWKAFATKYAGKELEGTGVNMFEPTALLGIAGIVALCVFVPGFLTFILFIFGRLRGTTTQLVQGIEHFSVQHPDEAAKLKQTLSEVMDRAPKAIVKRARDYWIDHKKVAEAATKNPVPTPA